MNLRFSVLRIAMIIAVLPIAQATAQEVRYPSATLPGQGSGVQINASVLKPTGAGPFPAVIVLHGCGGPDDHHRAWARKLVTWGYVAIIPDSFGPRGSRNICANTDAVGPALRVNDVIGTAEFLATQPYVQKGHIGVLGFSHGGWTVLKGAQETAYWTAYGIKAAVAFYPYCTPRADANISLPVLFFAGEKDDWTPAQRCKDMLQTLKRPDLVVGMFLPDAYHAFDRPGKTQWVQGLGIGGKVTSRKLEYSAQSTKLAETETRAFFQRFLH